MLVSIRYSGHRSLETMQDISSCLLTDPLGSPILIALEYAMQEGIAWTVAESDDPDFSKMIVTSGILHTLIPSSRFGSFCLLCTPILRKGIPKWSSDVDSFSLATNQGIPFALAYREDKERFRTVFHNAPAFNNQLQRIWNRQP